MALRERERFCLKTGIREPLYSDTGHSTESSPTSSKLSEASGVTLGHPKEDLYIRGERGEIGEEGFGAPRFIPKRDCALALLGRLRFSLCVEERLASPGDDNQECIPGAKSCPLVA